MSSLITNATIKVRRDTASNLTSNNPTPNQGEWVYETDTGFLKIGDGSTAWTSLAYGTGKNTNLEVINTIEAKDGITVPVMHVQDQKANNTVGGTFTSGAWQTRDLTTELANTIIGASLSSNQITLPAGTYRVVGIAPALLVNQHKCKWVNVTDVIELVGSSEHASSIGSTGTSSIIKGQFTIASVKVYELQHRCTTTRASDGFGTPSNYSVIEIYSDIFIEKIA